MLQVELESFYSQLSDLSLLSNSLTKQMDNPTIVHLTAQETDLRQKLFCFTAGIEKNSTFSYCPFT